MKRGFNNVGTKLDMVTAGDSASKGSQLIPVEVVPLPFVSRFSGAPTWKVNGRSLLRHPTVPWHFLAKAITLAEGMLFDFLINMETQLTWYGHAAFKITTGYGQDFADRSMDNQSGVHKRQRRARRLDRVDLIFLTHGHGDHVGNTVEIGKRTGASLVSNFDLNAAIVSVLGYPAGQAGNETTGHLGGQLSLLDGEVKVQFVPAWHGSSIERGKCNACLCRQSDGIDRRATQRSYDLSHGRHRFVFRHGACETISQDRRHAGLYRRSFYDGTASGRRSCEVGRPRGR